MKICILDYGSGNISSIKNLLSSLDFENIVSNDDKDIINSSHIILPGVGSYSSVMSKLKSNCNLDILENEILKKKNLF